MTSRDLRWLRRHTTADDLLDDGVENFSDLGRVDSADGREVADGAHAPSPPAKTHVRVDPVTGTHTSAAARRSPLGLLLGGVMAMGGVALVVAAPDMPVEHVRLRYLPTIIEHVTPAVARFYGVMLFAAGFVTLAMAFRRTR